MRGLRLSVILILSAALLLPPSPVAAAPTEAQRLAGQLAEVRSRARAAGRAYDQAYWRLDETEVRIDRVSAREKSTLQRLKKVRVRLASRASSMYRNGGWGYLGVLLGSRTFEEMVVRLDFFQRIGNEDAEAIAQAERLSSELARTRKALVEQRKRRASDVALLARRRDTLQADLASVQQRYADLQRRLSAEVAREIAESGRSSYTPPRGPLGMIFPVAGPNTYADTWGASRSGGRRRHKGTDIMAARGTPCVAVLGGSVTARTNRLGGKTIWLTASNGWQFYYAHLDSWTVTSGRVRAGQTIGTVGDTGNARGGSPHLHFEIHPNGGAAVNPYPYLRAME